jgi:hypothetical protein
MIGIRRKLAEWLYPCDMAALTRKNLNDIKVDSAYLDLPQDDYKKFLAEASVIFNRPEFKEVTSHLIAAQVEYVAREAQDVRQMDFARASINGISLVFEEFERLNSLYEATVKPKEDYDIHEIV